ncbi:phage major capsid protein [Streptomyces sp. NPDC005385]|uniref:phage major capsid protein n=1 Tax=Streptomyces sp. NPDC005385 TaxID=3157039 RepID=UPI00339DFC76
MTSLTNWIPVEYDPTTVSRANQSSAILSLANGIPMNTDTAYFRRSGGNGVTLGNTYSDDSSSHDKILLNAFKFGGQNKISEDDLNDAESWGAVVQPLANDWLISLAVVLDNACIGVTATGDGSTVPFDSVYKKVRSNGTSSSSESSYTADDNYINYNGTASGAYDALSSTLAKVEAGEYWDDTRALVIAHPAFRDVLRKAKDLQGQPIFVGGQGGDSGTPDTVFGVEIHWSRGAKTSPVPQGSPSGNPLLVFIGDRDNILMRGDRSPIESRMSEGRAHDSTDEVALKFRTRVAFAVGNAKGASVCEKTA